MNILKIVIVMGLSGSGKTTYLNKNYKNYIKFESFKCLKDIIRNFNDSELILDGLFLKNEDIIQILYTFSQVYCEETIDVEIIYFKPNIEYCLWNNNGKNKQNIFTKIEYPNVDLIKKETTKRYLNDLKNYSLSYYQDPNVFNINIIEKEIEKKSKGNYFYEKYTNKKTYNNLISKNDLNDFLLNFYPEISLKDYLNILNLFNKNDYFNIDDIMNFIEKKQFILD